MRWRNRSSSCSLPAACRRSAAPARSAPRSSCCPAVVGSERRAASVWARAGVLGAAIGPAVGGLLTELISWQSIFIVQVPPALACAVAFGAVARAESQAGFVRDEIRASGTPHLAANAALGLISAALAAALFLVVLLLIEGWRLTPIAAAAAVTVMPVCAVLATPLARRVPAVDARAAAGAILIAGGLTATRPASSGNGCRHLRAAGARRRRPRAHPLGADRGGTRGPLATSDPRWLDDCVAPRRCRRWTSCADAGVHRGPRDRAGGRRRPPVPRRCWTLGSRSSRRSSSPRGSKTQIEAEGDKVPVLDPAFEPLPSDPQERAGTLALRGQVGDEIDKAATHAFSASFLISAAFALAALIPIMIARRRISL